MTPAARARNGDLMAFAANGLFFASWMSRVPDVKQLLDLGPGLLSVLLLGVSLGSLSGLPLAGRIARRLGAARAVRAGSLVAVPGMIYAALAVVAHAPIVAILPGLYLVGLGTGVWDVCQNLEGTVVEQAVGWAIMPWFHAAFSFGTVLGALAGVGLVAMQIPIPVHLIIASLLCLALVWWGTAGFLPAFGETTEAQGHTPTRQPRLVSAWREPRTLLIGVMVLAAAFAEGTANDWMAVAFADEHQMGHALGVLALAVFLTFMTVGRIFGPLLLDRYGRVAVLRLLFGAAIVGCLIVVFAPGPSAYIGAAIWGLGASLGFPVGMSAAADDPSRAAARLSVVSTIGYGAFLAGPPLLGFLGDRVGVLHALLVVAVVSGAALLVVPQARPLVVPHACADPTCAGDA